MADFKSAFEHVLKWEGGYSNDPLDHGGETIFGIARRFHPAWPGWIIVDAAKPNVEKALKDEQLRRMVMDFYEVTFWGRLGEINCQAVAEKAFSYLVNMSPKSAGKIVQRAINMQGFKLPTDGIIGNQTIAAINQCDQILLMQDLRAAGCEFYCKRVIEEPSQMRFIWGWLRRACS